MLSSIVVVAAFTAAPTAPRVSAATAASKARDGPGVPVMSSLDRRQALHYSIASAVLAGMPLASHATATADGGNQELDNSAMRFNNKNLGGISDYKGGGVDDTEAAMARIAQKNRELAEENERKRLARFRQKTQAELDAEIEAEKAKSKNLILGIAGGGTLLSGVFIIPNLRRLGIKIASGGADRGYDSVPVSRPHVSQQPCACAPLNSSKLGLTHLCMALQEPSRGKKTVKRGGKQEAAVVDPFANSPFRSRRFQVSQAVEDDEPPPKKRFGLF